MLLYLELLVMFIYIKNNMLSYIQFQELIGNLIGLYKSACLLQGGMYKSKLLKTIEKTIPILLSEAYGNVVANEIINFIKDECEYDIKEIYELLDDNCKLISKDSAYALWKLEEIYPNNEMFSFFKKFISENA